MLILKNLLRRKVRTILSILGIAIGIAAIIAFNAVGRGFRASLDEYMRETDAQLLVVDRSALLPEYSRVSKEEQDFVSGLPEVEHLSPGTFTMASPRSLKKDAPVQMMAVLGRTPGDRLLEKFRRQVEGRLLEGEDEAMVGRALALDLGLRPGDTFQLFDRTFRVAGVFRSAVRFETKAIILPNSAVQKKLGIGERISMGFIYLKAGADPGRVQGAVRERYPNLDVIRVDQFTTYYDPIEYIDWFVWIVSLVSVAVGGLGVLNTMLMAVSERTREIGTLRAVGWGRGQVLRLILSEGVVISVVGGVVGLGLGTVGAEILIQWAPGGLDTRYAPLLFAQAMGVAVGLGLLGAFYPAWQASRLSPIEALKYE